MVGGISRTHPAGPARPQERWEGTARERRRERGWWGGREGAPEGALRTRSCRGRGCLAEGPRAGGGEVHRGQGSGPDVGLVAGRAVWVPSEAPSKPGASPIAPPSLPDPRPAVGLREQKTGSRRYRCGCTHATHGCPNYHTGGGHATQREQHSQRVTRAESTVRKLSLDAAT